MKADLKHRTAASEVDLFLAEWICIQTELANATTPEAKEEVLRKSTLLPTNEPHNFTTKQGYRHLRAAAILLLKDEGLTQKITVQTAFKCLTDAFFHHLPKGLAKGRLSEFAVLDGAKTRLAKSARLTGDYVFPLIFSGLATKSDFEIGPVRFLSKRAFVRYRIEALRRAKDDAKSDEFGAYDAWVKHIRSYDHFAVIHIVDHEEEMAWKIGREAIEFVLNIIRMTFRFQVTDDIRIGGGYIWETERSAISFDVQGNTHFITFRGPWSSTLPEGWTSDLAQELGQFFPVISAYLALLVSGEASGSPILERLRYASGLIAEAYSEPHDNIRLVRIISALEALALVEGSDKAATLAIRCAMVGGWVSISRANAIYDTVIDAYQWRNAIVHGDAPSIEDVVDAFLKLEQFLLHIFMGYFSLFEIIHRNDKPPSIRLLRRNFKKRVDFFLWYPSMDF